MTDRHSGVRRQKDQERGHKNAIPCTIKFYGWLKYLQSEFENVNVILSIEVVLNYLSYVHFTTCYIQTLLDECQTVKTLSDAASIQTPRCIWGRHLERNLKRVSEDTKEMSKSRSTFHPKRQQRRRNKPCQHHENMPIKCWPPLTPLLKCI